MDDRYREWVTEDYEPQLWIGGMVAAGSWSYYLGSQAEFHWHIKENITMMNPFQFLVFIACLLTIVWLGKRMR